MRARQHCGPWASNAGPPVLRDLDHPEGIPDGHFLFEHPAHATTWEVDFVKQMAERPDVHLVLAHQCRFGQKGRDSMGEALVKKPTRFLTNCAGIAHQLDVCSDRRHSTGYTYLLRD